MRLDRVPNVWQRLLSNTEGHSAIEYSLILALVVGSIVLSGGLLVRTSQNISILGKNGFSEIAGPAGPTDSQGRHGLQSLEVEFESKLARSVPVGLLVFLMTCAAYGTYVLWRMSQPKKEQTAEKESAADTTNSLFDKRQNILRIISSDMHFLLESRLEVRHLMSKRVTTVDPKTTVKQITETMTTQQLRHLMVCDHSRLIGVISDRDLHKSNAHIASDLMTKNPICVEPDSAVGPAITQLMNKRISCLPVTANGELVGVLTKTDLMMALQCTLQVLGKLSAELRSAQEPHSFATADSSTTLPSDNDSTPVAIAPLDFLHPGTAQIPNSAR